VSVRFAGTGADQLTYAGFPDPNPITVTAWAYISVDRNAQSTLIRARNNSAQVAVNIATATDGQRIGLLQGATLPGPTVCTAATWYRIAITRTAAGAAVYVAQDANGATASATGAVTALSSPTLVTLGGRDPGDTGNPFNGRLAHVRVWAAELTQTEIEAEWLAFSPVRTSNLYAAWPLPDVSTLTDQSGNGRTLTIPGNSPTTEADPPIPNTGALAGALPVLASLGGQWAGNVGISGTFDGALPVLPAPGGQLIDTVLASGRWSAGTPTRPARWQAGTPTRPARWSAGVPTRPARWTTGAPS
jgi:hypothetical protein